MYFLKYKKGGPGSGPRKKGSSPKTEKGKIRKKQIKDIIKNYVTKKGRVVTKIEYYHAEPGNTGSTFINDIDDIVYDHADSMYISWVGKGGTRGKIKVPHLRQINVAPYWEVDPYAKVEENFRA